MERFKTGEVGESGLWWLGLDKDQMPENVILTLELDIMPEHFAAELRDFRHVSGQSEYKVYVGNHAGIEVAIVYAGSGAFSHSTAIDELAKAGTRTLVRVGNCGGFSRRIRVGDIILSAGAIRGERTLIDYVGLEYPAFADRDLLAAFTEAARLQSVPVAEGLTVSVGTFYPGSGIETPLGLINEEHLRSLHVWQKIGALNLDAETSTVLVLGRLYRMQALSLLSVGNHLLTGEGAYSQNHGALVRLALEGLRINASKRG